MGIFRRHENQQPAPKTDLEQTMRRLEGEMRGLRLEWENTFDKVMKAVSRINARNRRNDVVEEERQPEQPASPAGIGTHEMMSAARARRGGR